MTKKIREKKEQLCNCQIFESVEKGQTHKTFFLKMFNDNGHDGDDDLIKQKESHTGPFPK